MAQNTNSPTAAQLKGFIERIEKIEEDRDACTADRKEVYTEAKDEGYDTKAIRKIVKMRKMDTAKRKEEEAILSTYCEAIGLE